MLLFLNGGQMPKNCLNRASATRLQPTIGINDSIAPIARLASIASPQHGITNSLRSLTWYPIREQHRELARIIHESPENLCITYRRNKLWQLAEKQTVERASEPVV